MKTQGSTSVAELLQSPKSKPYLKCAVCFKNFLSVTSELKKPWRTDLVTTPVIGKLLKSYFKKPIFRDQVVESNVCRHKFHLSCIVKHQKKKPLIPVPISDPKWICPLTTCARPHYSLESLVVSMRTDHLVGFYSEAIEVHIKCECFPVYIKCFIHVWNISL